MSSFVISREIFKPKFNFPSRLVATCHDKVKLGGEEIKNVTTFKYLGSMFDAEGGTTTDCKNRVRLACNKWREVTGVICDKKVPVKLKHKIYKTVIRPTMTYGAECWTMKKKDEMLMNIKTEMRMLRWIQGVSLREHKRNEEIYQGSSNSSADSNTPDAEATTLIWTCQTER